MQAICKIEFPEDEMYRVPNAPDEPLYERIHGAVTQSGAKVTGNRLENGWRKMKILMPSSEAEAIFKLACDTEYARMVRG